MLKRRVWVSFLSIAMILGLAYGSVQFIPNKQKKPVPAPKPDIQRLSQSETRPQNVSFTRLNAADEQLKKTLVNKYQNQLPAYWGENVPGVITKINTENKVIALTFDACGGPGSSSGYDKELIDFLIKEKVPATLFINARWIDANYDIFMELAKNPLFEIENHGSLHKPLSVNGKSAYNIAGTLNISEVVDEILMNERKIENLTGRKPIYFRSGTAYYDDVAVKIVGDLGLKAVNYNVLGDAGATFNTEQVKSACLNAAPGSIILMHMNHPEKYTAEGVIAAVPQLKNRGFSFVKLEDYDSKLAPKTPIVAAPKPTVKDYFYHTAVRGDTLWKISTKYSVPIKEIQAFNNLTTTIINVGQKLKIPVIDRLKLIPPVDVFHVVVKGD